VGGGEEENDEKEASPRAARLLPPQLSPRTRARYIWRDIEASLSEIRRQAKVMVVGRACDKTCCVSGSARRALMDDEFSRLYNTRRRPEIIMTGSSNS